MLARNNKFENYKGHEEGDGLKEKKKERTRFKAEQTIFESVRVSLSHWTKEKYVNSRKLMQQMLGNSENS